MTTDPGKIPRPTLDPSTVDVDPLRQFGIWYDDAVNAGIAEPNAMTLATIAATGRPNARIVLLKEVQPGGFVFYTNYWSAKGRELGARPDAALLFFWQSLERQVRVVGVVRQVSAAESDAYFATRPRGSQLGAWASNQSDVLASREDLEAAYAAAEARFRDSPVTRPPHWGGFVLAPIELEFWQGRPSRLHDRVRYRQGDGSWIIERLAP